MTKKQLTTKELLRRVFSLFKEMLVEYKQEQNKQTAEKKWNDIMDVFVHLEKTAGGAKR